MISPSMTTAVAAKDHTFMTISRVGVNLRDPLKVDPYEFVYELSARTGLSHECVAGKRFAAGGTVFHGV